MFVQLKTRPFTFYYTLHYSYLSLYTMLESSIESSYLNAGKFAAVSSIPSSDLAFKTVHSDSHLHREELIKEFHMYVFSPPQAELRRIAVLISTKY